MNNAITITYAAKTNTISGKRERIGNACLIVTTGALMGAILASPPDIYLMVPVVGLVLVCLTVLISKAERKSPVRR